MSPAQDRWLGFVGVSTAESSIQRVFPAWADALGLPTRTLRGYDVALDAPEQTYRELVQELRDDPHCAGALVTTHKMAVYAAAGDLFDEVDDLGQTFAEISCISKRGDRLRGQALDPVTARLALEEFLPPDHFARTAAAALVLGSGGAGTALSQQLGVREDAPAVVVCTALTEEPLEHARQVHARAGIAQGRIRYHVTAEDDDADRLVADLPPGSLVVNATGMGKDRPGSPLGDDVVFPEGGLVWEFNYRGPRDFLVQAHAQEQSRGLHVEDGWRYFVHGWSQAVAAVFEVPMPPETVDELSRIAAEQRS